MNGGTNLKTWIVISVFLLGMGCTVAAGRTIYVDNYGTGDFNNIQAAINDANDGDTVIVADGIYTGDGNRDIDFSNGLPQEQTRAITVRSANGPQNCVIDCNGTGTEPHRGFNFHSNEDANSVVDGFTITNGHGFIEPEYPNWYLGGGIYCAGSGPTITNCIITGNSATQGGGIFAWKNSSPRITDCTVSGNSSGIYCWRNSSLDIEDSIISGTGRRGIYCRDSPTVSIVNCTIANNGTAGIDSHGDGPLTISNCRISDNQGSGIQALVQGTNTATISNCVISGNNSSFDGGGIRVFTFDDGVLNVTNCTITGNSAIDSFGNIGRGGGVSCSRGNIIISNSITWNNVGGDIYVWNYPPPPCQGCTVEPTEVAVSYSCTGQIIVEEDPIFGDPNLILGDGNIDADPCFADPNNGDYHLKSQAGRWEPSSQSWVQDDVTSPCIDAGNPISPIGNEPFPNGGRINMGAFGGTARASKSYFGGPVCEIIVAGDVNGDCKVNFLDFRLMALNWLRDENQ